MKVIPIIVAPSQTLSVQLAAQQCRINVYQKSTGLFCDLLVNDTLIIGGVIARNGVRIVRDAYLGFDGDIAFIDTTDAQEDPHYAGLGSRWLLLYLEAADIA